MSAPDNYRDQVKNILSKARRPDSEQTYLECLNEKAQKSASEARAQDALDYCIDGLISSWEDAENEIRREDRLKPGEWALGIRYALESTALTRDLHVNPRKPRNFSYFPHNNPHTHKR